MDGRINPMDGEEGDGLSSDHIDHVDERQYSASATDISFLKFPTSTKYVVEKYLLGKTPFIYLTGIGANLDFRNSKYCCIVIVLSGDVTIKSHHDGARDLVRKNIGFIFSDSFSLESTGSFEIYIARISRDELEKRSSSYLQRPTPSDEDISAPTMLIVDFKKFKVFSSDGLYDLLDGIRKLLNSEWADANINVEELLQTYFAIMHAFSTRFDKLSVKSRRQTTEDTIDRLCDKVKSNPHKNYTSKDFETITGLTRRVLHYSFIRRYGVSPLQWAMRAKLDAAREIIIKRNGDISITRLAEEMNFASSSRFAEYYRRAFAETPKQTALQIRNNHKK